MSQVTRAQKAIDSWLASTTEKDPHTQEVLADRISKRVGRTISQSTISAIKHGSQPRADIIAALKVEIGIEAEWWLPSRSTRRTGTNG